MDKFKHYEKEEAPVPTFFIGFYVSQCEYRPVLGSVPIIIHRHIKLILNFATTVCTVKLEMLLLCLSHIYIYIYV